MDNKDITTQEKLTIDLTKDYLPATATDSATHPSTDIATQSPNHPLAQAEQNPYPSRKISIGENEALKLAVVGHTNTGKTSLLRTLLRDMYFGEVKNAPATTRHVEKAMINDSQTGQGLVALIG